MSVMRWCCWLVFASLATALVGTGGLWNTTNATALSNSSSTTGDASRLWANITTLINATSTNFTSQTPKPSTSSSFDPIIECDEKWGSWSRSISYKPTATQIFTKVLISTKTSYGTTHTCSSTCGKVCYADVKTLNSSIWSSTSTEFDTYVSYVTYKGTTPGCSIPPASCTSMLDDFDRSTYAYNQWELGPRTDPEPPWPRTPACQQCRRSSCIIEADGNVELIYWPVATNQSRDMCTDFPTEKLTDPFQPVTPYNPDTTGSSAMLNGKIFHKGNAYVSIPAASARDNCNSRLGKVHSSIILTIASSDVYSFRWDVMYAGGFHVNFADFHTPYPWSAYKGQLWDCNSGIGAVVGPACTSSVVFEDGFHPMLHLPMAIQNVDPEWAGCRPNVMLMDPPIALAVATFLTTQTPPPPTPTAAQPGTGPDPNPPQTQAPGPGGVNDPPGGRPPGGRPPEPTGGRGDGNAPSDPKITIGPTVIPIAPGGDGLIIDPGTTIHKGGSGSVIDGTTVRIGDHSITLISPSGTTTLPIDSTQPSSSHFIIGGREFTLDPAGHLIAAPITLNSNDPPVLIAGYTVSINANGLTIVNTSTGEIRFIPFSALQRKEGESFNVDGTTMMASGSILSVGTEGVVVVDPKGGTSTFTGLTEGDGQATETVGSAATAGSGATGSGAARGRAGSSVVVGVVGCIIIGIVMLIPI